MRACLPARSVSSSPRWTVPANCTDCHLHIMGPYDRYALSPRRTYSPPEALIPAYLSVAATIGIARMVVVQPSVYGTDNRCTLDAVDVLGRERARAVVVLDDDIDDRELLLLNARGVRGVRFNVVSGNGTPLDRLAELGRRIAPLGWHVQLYAPCDQVVALAPALHDLPVPIVLDHLAGVRGGGSDSRGFAAVVDLLRAGRTYVKLCVYRSSATGYPYDDVAPLVRSFIEAAPDRCLWGTDWPHPDLYVEGQVPDDGELIDLLGGWAPTDAIRQAILVDNPARLYGFDS